MSAACAWYAAGKEHYAQWCVHYNADCTASQLRCVSDKARVTREQYRALVLARSGVQIGGGTLKVRAA